MFTPSQEFKYIGSELELFAEAVNWRRYWQQQVRPFLGRRVLEVGAGIGSITRDLCSAPVERWVAIEPDPAMAARLAAEARTGRLPPMCEPRCCTAAMLRPDECFDSVLYIDVLEHIEDDRAEVERITQHLAPGGYLIVLAPAHQSLYTPFDAAIGHCRRYSMTGLLAVATEDVRLCRARYLDSVGLLASLANRILLRSAQPSRGQIQVWDRIMVRLSRRLDPLLGYRLGKSVLAVWRKTGRLPDPI